MRYVFKFPDIGEGITEGKILEWYVHVGQKIKSGDLVVKVETDKVVDDIPSPKDGTVVARFGEVDEVIRVNAPLITIDLSGDDYVAEDEEKAPVVAKPVIHKPASTVNEPGFGVVGQLEISDDVMPDSEEGTVAERDVEDKVSATPVARRMARKLNIDLNAVNGTGPDGRITKTDVLRFKDAGSLPKSPTSTMRITTIAQPSKGKVSQASAPTQQPPPAPVPVEFGDGAATTPEPLTQIRKAIARQMTLSKQTVPHMTVFEEVEISQLVEFRQSQKEKFAEMGVKLTYLPFILKALAAGLKKHPKINSKLDLDQGVLHLERDINIGIAVDAPDGLMVPVIRHADRLSIYELASRIADIAERARHRRLALAELKGGTFTVTNFGAIAGIHAAPIINYPEVGILGVGRIIKTPVVKGDQLAVGQVLPLSLAVDHRAVDGGDITRFLKEIMDLLADPMALLLM